MNTWLRVVAGVGVGLACTQVRAGDFFCDFKTDPTAILNIIGTGQWSPTDGVGGVDDGYLAVTDAKNSENTKIIFDDFDNGLIVKAFKFECDLRIGNGTESPADGFSINYAAANDPAVEAHATDVNGWSGTENEPGAPAGNGLPEEGTTTGLAIGFDAWLSGSLNWPADGRNAGLTDIRGISVRVNNKIITQVELPTRNGGCDDNTSLQTGPRDGTGGVLPLCWKHFSAEITEDGKLTVIWKDRFILDAFAIEWTPIPGRMIFGGRTGGANQNHHIDNIKIHTVRSDAIIVGAATATPIGFRIDVGDSGQSVVDPGTAELKLNGNAVPVKETAKNGANTTFSWYDVAAPMTAGSTITVEMTVKDLAGKKASGTKTAVVPAYLTLPPDKAVTGVDTSKKGFKLRNHWSLPDSTTTTLGAGYWEFPNTVARAEQQLYGMLGANIAQPADYIEADTINYSNDYTVDNGDGTFVMTQYGAFTEGNGYGDRLTPGLDSPASNTYNQATEILTYLYFAQAGAYYLTFNSDDGFRTTVDTNPKEVLKSLVISQFDGGRGASDTTQLLYVPAAGYYGFRTVWEQGGGGGNYEWSGNRDMPAQAPRKLLNDSTDPNAIMAFYERTGDTPAAITFVNPVRNSGNPYMVDIVITAEIEDGTATVDQGSVKLNLNGADVQATVTKTGAKTKVIYDPPGNLARNTTFPFSITYAAGGQTVVATNSFTTYNTRVIPPSFAMNAADVDKTKAGFLVRTRHQMTGMGNSTYEAEILLAGLFGWPNTADSGAFTEYNNTYAPEYYVINYNGGNDQQGNFRAANGYADTKPPGIPGGPNLDNTDNYAQEILTVLDLRPGIYAMGVNSDDGFRLTVGNPAANEFYFPFVLGEFSGGRGASDTWFTFEVLKAGLYPFRLMWEEGGGGNNCEWFSMVYEKPTSIIHSRTLVNDTGLPEGSFIHAYWYPVGKAAAPYVSAFGPARSGRGNRTGTDAPIWMKIVEDGGSVEPATVTLQVDGADVTPTVTKSGGVVTISYAAPAEGWTLTNHTARITYGDRTNVPLSWTFRLTNAIPAAKFFIEAEDFDYDGGKTKAEASVMPYLGGAYAGLAAVVGTDYQRNNDGSSPLYRYGEDPQQPMDLGPGDRDRMTHEVQVNFKLGWVGDGEWFNYTRDIPAGKYNVYAALSHGDGPSNATALQGTLSKLEGATVTDLGTFLAPGSGGWGNNCLVPLKDADGNVLALDLGGTTTLRYTDRGGDWDFMAFVPYIAPVEPPKFTKWVVNANGSITIEWTGGGTLQMAEQITGPWQDTPYTSPLNFVPDPQVPILFGRIKR